MIKDSSQGLYCKSKHGRRRYSERVRTLSGENTRFRALNLSSMAIAKMPHTSICDSFAARPTYGYSDNSDSRNAAADSHLPCCASVSLDTCLVPFTRRRPNVRLDACASSRFQAQNSGPSFRQCGVSLQIQHRSAPSPAPLVVHRSPRPLLGREPDV